MRTLNGMAAGHDTAFSQGIGAIQDHVLDLKQQISGEPALPQTLLQVAFETMNSTLEELRVAEEEMRAQNEELSDSQVRVDQWRRHYEDLFDAAPDAYLVSDLQGAIREANQAAQTLLNVSKRFLIGKPLAVFIANADRAAFRDLLLDAPAEVDETWDARTEHEMTLQPRKSALVAVAATVAVIHGPQGTPTGLRWLIRDVGARGAAEAERYRRVVAEITDHAIFLLDADGVILSWNGGAKDILGYAEAEAVGLPFGDLYPPEDRTAGLPAREMAQAAAGGRVAEEGWMRRKDGGLFWASGSLTLLPGAAGVPRGYVKVARDETARRRREERLAAAFAREHRIAETFQNALLSEVASDAFPGMEVATLYAAASDEALVGGDFFDALSLGDGRVALVVGDVSGKGLAAAARTAEIKHALRAYLRETPAPGAALSRLSAFLYDSQRLSAGTKDAAAQDADASAFVTLAVLVVRPETGEAWASAAGAEPPLLVRADGRAEPVPAQGPLPGLTPDAEYAELALTLEPGDTLVLVTDGITEARRGREFLDYSGLTRLARGARSASDVCAMGEAILSGARDFAGALSDDACLLLARRA